MEAKHYVGVRASALHGSSGTSRKERTRTYSPSTLTAFEPYPSWSFPLAPIVTFTPLYTFQQPLDRDPPEGAIHSEEGKDCMHALLRSLEEVDDVGVEREEAGIEEAVHLRRVEAGQGERKEGKRREGERPRTCRFASKLEGKEEVLQRRREDSVEGTEARTPAKRGVARIRLFLLFLHLRLASSSQPAPHFFSHAGTMCTIQRRDSASAMSTGRRGRARRR
jgi:hypothetical protein